MVHGIESDTGRSEESLTRAFISDGPASEQHTDYLPVNIRLTTDLAWSVVEATTNMVLLASDDIVLAEYSGG